MNGTAGSTEGPGAWKPARRRYLDILELAWEAYGLERIAQRLTADGTSRMDLHSYSRVLTVLSCLIHGGRKAELKDLWKNMMLDCCRDLPGDPQADFCIKEIMFSQKMMKGCLPDWEESSAAWMSELRKVDPYMHYGSVLREGKDPATLHNINIYNMAGEFLRETEGLTDTAAYFAAHWPVQLERFDENGMYRDPGNPILYDLTTRCQIQLLLGFGYSGPYAAALDARLKKGGLATLRLQSVSGELAYGGRSNQFLFNEALIAANGEYEAVRYAGEGNLELAGAFKQSARLAVEAIMPWLQLQPPRHIKNKYPIESWHGTENYGYYDKYMITLGAFLAIGYWFADDSIPEAECPAAAGGYVWNTSPSFHRITAQAGGYSIQVDTAADKHYDATGLGRIHCRGVPTELILSTPLSHGDKYRLSGGLERTDAAIGPGWRDPQTGEIRYLAQCASLAAELQVLEESAERVSFQIIYRGEELPFGVLKETYQVSAEGVALEAELGGTGDSGAQTEIYFRIPLIASNGQEVSRISSHAAGVQLELNGYSYKASFGQSVELQRATTRYGNRNGEYVLAQARMEGNKARLQIEVLA
jgi:hypothetical protein